MLIAIRVALICAVISIVGSAPQSARPKEETPLDNEFVRVVVDPPLTSSHQEVLALGYNFEKTPLVQLRVPTQPVNHETGTLQWADLGKVSAQYVLPQGNFSGSRLVVNHEAFIYIYLKSVPPKSNFTDDAVKADPTHNEVILDNDRVRIVRIHFAPDEEGPIVDKRPRVIIARTDSHATVTFPDGHSEPRDMKAGAVSFGNAGRQATKNTGATPLENIVIELKSKDSERK
jgi:hypothetical protein